MKTLRFACSAASACAGLAIGCLVAAPQAHAIAELQEAGAASPAPTAASLQDVVSGTIEAVKQYGLPLDPVEARQGVRTAVLRAADPGARVLREGDAEQIARSREGIFFDSGLRIALTNSVPVVETVLPDSPAAEAGIEPGALVAEVNGKITADQHLPAVRRMLQDQNPGEVTLVLEDAEGDTRTVTVEKRPVQLPAVESAEELPLALGYVRVNALLDGSGARIADILQGWAGAGSFGAVLDLRGACGADLDSVVEVAGLLARTGEPLFTFRDAEGAETVYEAAEDGLLGMPLMLLVDEETTGAAELLAASLARSGRGAMLLGATTAGDPLVREKIQLADGDWIYLATRRLLTKGGAEYPNGEGVRPDVRVLMRDQSYRDYEPPPPLLTDRRETTEEEIETRRLRERTRGDVALTRAVDVLLGLKALDIHGFGFEPMPAR